MSESIWSFEVVYEDDEDEPVEEPEVGILELFEDGPACSWHGEEMGGSWHRCQ